MQCVTSFIDIGRGGWGNSYSRSVDKYIDSFIQFYSNVDLDLILFCDDSIKNFILNRINVCNFMTRIVFQNIQKDDLEYFKICNRVSNIQKSDSMIKYSSRDKSNPPEYSNPEYVCMMFAKSELLKISKDRGLLKSNDVAWIDFGIGHGDLSYISSVKNRKMVSPNSNKIILFNRQKKELSSDPYYYSSLSDNVLICGGFYVVPSNLIDYFFNGFKRVVYMLLDLGIVDDDQTILSILGSMDRENFEIIDSTIYRGNPNGGDWFPVFEFLK